MKNSRLSVPVVYSVSIVANLLVLYFVISQFNGIKSLTEFWNDTGSQNLVSATQLAEVERNFGYVGFIHHFKNYVIRGTEKYYQKAQQSYDQTQKSIQTLKKLEVNSADRTVIKTIEKTLEEYHQKLQLAKNKAEVTPINELDKIVRVDDKHAETALNELRSMILPRLYKQQQLTEQKVNKLNRQTIIISLLLIPIFLVSTVLTIRLIKQLSYTKDELTSIFNASPDSILYIDRDGQILKANAPALDLFGYSQEEFTTLETEDLVPEVYKKKHKDLRRQFSAKPQTREMGNSGTKIQGVKKDGSLLDLQIALASSEIHGIKRTVCIIKDITGHNELKLAAETDHLTAINNRRAFDEILQKELDHNARQQTALSLFMIDLDHFKTLNDKFGHAMGDKALIEVSQFLRKHTRHYDHLARWGGDEFVLQCPTMNAHEALKYAERIRLEFEQHTFAHAYTLTLSIGISTTDTQSPMSARELLATADKALYAAKQNGRNQVCHYELSSLE